MNHEQRKALFTMRHRTRTDMRTLADTGVTEAEVKNLIKNGYVQESFSNRHRYWSLTRKGETWVDRNLPSP